MGLFGVNEVLSVSSYLESQFLKNVNISVKSFFSQKNRSCPVYLYLFTAQSGPFKYGARVDVRYKGIQ